MQQTKPFVEMLMQNISITLQVLLQNKLLKAASSLFLLLSWDGDVVVVILSSCRICVFLWECGLFLVCDSLIKEKKQLLLFFPC